MKQKYLPVIYRVSHFLTNSELPALRAKSLRVFFCTIVCVCCYKQRHTLCCHFEQEKLTVFYPIQKMKSRLKNVEKNTPHQQYPSQSMGKKTNNSKMVFLNDIMFSCGIQFCAYFCHAWVWKVSLQHIKFHRRGKFLLEDLQTSLVPTQPSHQHAKS